MVEWNDTSPVSRKGKIFGGILNYSILTFESISVFHVIRFAPRTCAFHIYILLVSILPALLSTDMFFSHPRKKKLISCLDSEGPMQKNDNSRKFLMQLYYFAWPINI